MLRLTSSAVRMSLFERKRQLLHVLDLCCRPMWKRRYRSLARPSSNAADRCEWRGFTPEKVRADVASPWTTTAKANPPARIPSGRANAVRAAFKAGVKPSAIARQFGLSQADIRALLNSIRLIRRAAAHGLML